MAYTPVYPEGMDRETYDAALEKCILGGGWMFNQSELDVWYDFDGFVVKVPAGTRVRPDGWTHVRNLVSGMETEEFYGCQSPVNRCGFKFLSGHKLYIYNDLVVFSPDSARAQGGYIGPPGRTLEEHIVLINTMKLQKATIIASDLSFIPRCPSLRTVGIQFAQGLDRELDFSPLYDLPHLESLSIAAPNMGLGKGPAIRIDFTKLPGLRSVSVCTNDAYNYNQVPTLEQLWLSNDKRHRDLTDLSCSPVLKKLELLCCATKSLDGIGQFPLQWVSLSYLRGPGGHLRPVPVRRYPAHPQHRPLRQGQGFFLPPGACESGISHPGRRADTARPELPKEDAEAEILHLLHDRGGRRPNPLSDCPLRQMR